MPTLMSQNCDYDIRILKGLTAATLDSAQSYHEAADIARNDRFRAILLECADQRDDVLVRLHAHVWERGESPEADRPAYAGSNRNLINFVEPDARSELAEIMADLEKGDIAFREKLETALADRDLSIETTSLVRECYATFRECHDQMRGFIIGL